MSNTLSFGFTGSRYGMTDEQKATFVKLIHTHFAGLDSLYWHFGDCLGADQEAFDLVRAIFPFSSITVAWPGSDPNTRAHCRASIIKAPNDNLTRDSFIAYHAIDGLFATPKTINEILRSGTWATIRKAWRLGRRIWVIRPDGSLNESFKSDLVVYKPGKEIDAWGL